MVSSICHFWRKYCIEGGEELRKNAGQTRYTKLPAHFVAEYVIFSN